MFGIVKRIKKGFSLLELMTTLVVLAILMGIALPTYREYQIRAHMADAIIVLNNFIDVAKQQYVSAHTIPSSINGVAAGAWTSFTSTCITDIYYDDGTAWANAGKGAMVQGVISDECGLGIKGFVAGQGNTNNTITVAFLAAGDLMQEYCGSWADDGTQVPFDYLPSSCQNDAFATLVTG